MSDNRGRVRRLKGLALKTIATLLVLVPWAAWAECPEPDPIPQQRAKIDHSYQAEHPPYYPKAAHRDGVEGEVSILVGVAGDGSISCQRLIRSSLNRDLDRAAMEAVRRWKFIPAGSEGAPVPDVVRVTVPFTLDSAVFKPDQSDESKKNAFDLVDALVYDFERICRQGALAKTVSPNQMEAFCACYAKKAGTGLPLMKVAGKPRSEAETFLKNAQSECRREVAVSGSSR